MDNCLTIHTIFPNLPRYNNAYNGIGDSTQTNSVIDKFSDRQILFCSVLFCSVSREAVYDGDKAEVPP